ncbi:MAG: SIMPL domain-containing protein, partial [Desulfobacterales bacterium]|nr:SIMPL domain-containing protein [Desulfobacterales bacterium]
MNPARKSHQRPSFAPLRRTAAAAAACLLLAAGLDTNALAAGPAAEASLPAVTVTGNADVAAAPDRARLSLGTVVETRQAADAQKQLAQIIQRVLGEIKALGVPEEKIRTTGLALTPVYSQPKPRADPEPEAPRIVGYRATNSVTIQLDDLGRVGAVIDAGIAAGANQLSGLSFELKNDLPPRQQALRLAAQEARVKAETIAAALNLQLGEVLDVR